MNRCAIQQNNFDSTVVCPKPRRPGIAHATLDPSYAKPLRWHMSHQQEDCDSRAGNELLDIILAKGNNCGNSEQTQSPPFFSGSPPSRVSNPLIQDVRFGDEKYSSVQSPSSNRKAGCVVRASFGNNPAVRVEGFDCLDRDRRNCTIPTLA